MTTDGNDARCSRNLNNRIEQDQRAIKQRSYPMRGFGSFASAARFYPALEEQRQYFRTPSRPHGRVPLAAQRCLFQDRGAAALAETAAA